MNWTVEEIPELQGYCVEWAEPGNFYLSRRNVVFHCGTLKPPFTKIAAIDAAPWKTAVSGIRLAQRLLRFMVMNVVPLADGSIFVTFDKSVGVIRDGKYRHLDGLSRPCRVLRGSCAVDEKGSIYFGEYLANTERGPMQIYRYQTGGDAVEAAHTFPAGSIKHIHGIYYDTFTQSLYCLTGDDEKECKILRTADGFETIDTVGSGDETWRAVSMLFSKHSVFYGTDAEFRDNQILELDRKTGERRPLGTVNGTVFYSKHIGSDLFFTTTAENAPAQAENTAALWVVADGECRQLAKFKKDRWHTSLFQFGTIHLPHTSRLPEELYFQVVAVEGDGRVFRARSITA